MNPMQPNFTATQSYKKLIRDVKATHAVMVFDSKEGDLLRKGMDPMYKANRRKKPQREIDLIRKFRKSLDMAVVTVKGRDGDDVMFELALQSEHDEVIIATADKDLLQCVSEGEKISVYCPMKKQHYKTRADVEKRMGIGPEKVALYLALRGDTVDNVKGVAGIGEVKAKKILATARNEAEVAAQLSIMDRGTFSKCLQLTTVHGVKLRIPDCSL
jgi:DNA polymerase-1